MDGIKMEHADMVTVPLWRFEELIEAETRLKVLATRLIQNNLMERVEALEIIGEEGAARKLREEEKRQLEEYRRERLAKKSDSEREKK